jgi:hypothetical protein
MEELCTEKFPETKEKNIAAYADWKTQNNTFIREMEGQFDVMERYWKKILPNANDIGSAVRKLRVPNKIE